MGDGSDLFLKEYRGGGLAGSFTGKLELSGLDETKVGADQDEKLTFYPYYLLAWSRQPGGLLHRYYSQVLP